MDQGAHFHRCDFQVHSPRDTNWNGVRPQDEAERKAYADAFIAACREKGLDSVAITDHHDICFFPYIKDAAQNELDSSGDPIPANERITVFPGMELTLGVPCQALLILDADFPVDFLTTLYTVLACGVQDHATDRHLPTVRLDDITNLGSLCEMLDRLDHLKGHYILLPNVSEGGSSSIIRSKFQATYKAMPCVGGYVDGSIANYGEGITGILNGKNKEYGFKAIGVIQTSDNRRQDFQELGKHTSWIKWAVPTAEALRQACLASATRISNSLPQLPALIIDHIDVSNSRFLGPAAIEFNPQFNCLIGGRGTGKSTILEYLRWALCDQPPAIAPDEDLPNFQKKRVSLIEKTLIPFEAVVTVGFTIHGVPHLVRRNSRTKDLLLKIDDAAYKPCTEDDIRALIPLQAYSQKQLSAVGVRNDELLRFVLAPINKQISQFASQVEGLKGQVRAAYGQVQKKRLIKRELDRDELKVQSLAKQLETLKKGLVGLLADDQRILAEHDIYVKEEQAISTWDREVADFSDLVRNAAREVDNLPSRVEPSALLNQDIIRAVATEIESVFRQAKEHLRAAALLLDRTTPTGQLEEVRDLRRSWDSKYKDHTTAYQTVKTKLATQQTQVSQIEKTEADLKLLNGLVSTNRQKLIVLGEPEIAYRAARQEWAQLYKTRADLIESRCTELTTLSSGVIRATLRRGAGTSAAAEKMTADFVGTRIRGRKIEELCEQIAGAADSVGEWNRVLEELESLAALEAQDGKMMRLPETPLLSRGGLTRDELERVATQLEIDTWLALSLVELGDVPQFEYRLGDVDYINFADASAGQQATALLSVLLNQAGPPLIVDQPEEDLDNAIILDIVHQLWSAKQYRQIIFTSHNANIVVNGDADLVACCGYRKAGDQTKGTIKCQGAIDVALINQEITTVMEGGKEAFRLRKEKYGF